MNILDERIKVVDSPCGTGKTSWAIDYINQLSPEQKVIYITPFLKECERVQNGVKRKIIQPDARLGQGRKRNHFLSLIQREENIASTHSLFADIDNEIIDYEIIEKKFTPNNIQELNSNEIFSILIKLLNGFRNCIDSSIAWNFCHLITRPKN